MTASGTARIAKASVRSSQGVAYRVGQRLITDGVPVLILLIWYLESFNQPEFILPSPIKVAIKTADLLGLDPLLAKNTLDSIVRVLVSVGISLGLGTMLVMLARYVPITRGFIVFRLMPFLNAAPALGWAIIGLYWFRVSDLGVIFVEVAILLPFTMINMWEGLNNLDEELLEMANSFTRNRAKTLRAVVFPMLLPYLFIAIRVSYGTCWKVALFAELFGAPSGLGHLLNLARENLDSVTVFASVLVMIILVFLVQSLILDRVERWLQPQRKAGATLGAQ